MRTLKDAALGEKVIVKKVCAQGALKRRIVDMGITKGTTVQIRRVAPLGDPIEINLRNYNLSIRKADAKNIWIEE